jgi:iron complex outermembrane receptor protein
MKGVKGVGVAQDPKFSVLLVTLLIIPTVAVAAEPVNVFTLGEIEVSAKADEDTTNPTVERLYADELRAFDRTTVAEAANLLPGVTTSETGARNEQTLSIRGFDIKHVPLFLDGIPIYMPYDGYPDLGRFTTFDLSEIVVSKGFTSVLYGPNTMGGAINMVSRRPIKVFEGEAGAGYGTGNTYNAYTNIGTNQGSWYLQAGASYLNSDYFMLSDDFSPTTAEDGDHRNNSYRRDKKLNVKVGFTPNENDEYAFSFINQQGEKGSSPYAGSDPAETIRYWQWPYWDKQSYYFTSKTELPGKSYIKTRAYHDIFKNSLYSYDDDSYTTISKKYAFRGQYDDYTDGVSLELGSSSLADNLLKLALHYKRDVHREQDEGEPELTFKDQIFSVGLEDTITISEKLFAIAGVSYDTVDTLQAEYLSTAGTIADFPKGSTSGVNPQLGLFYSPTKADNLHVSVAQKTRLPSIKDRYSYRLGTAIPNPDLDPEKSINYEIGYENTRFETLNLKGTVFYNDVSDFIQLTQIADPDNPGKTIDQNKNIGKVALSGFELEASAQLLRSLEIGGNYTYTHADNKSNANKLIDIPKHKVVAYLRYTLFDRLIGQVDAEYDSKRYSSTDGGRIADDYIVANLKLGYDLGNGFLAETGVANVLDENYELQEGYPQAGRTLFANVRYTF